MSYLLFFLICYLCGSIPWSFILVKMLKGVDLRTVGSGNLGATNAGRVLGHGGLVAVTFLDAAKAYLPLSIMQGEISSDIVILIGAVMILLGHTFSVFMMFRGGGKGVACSLGIGLALAPAQIIFVFLVFSIVLIFSKMVSLSSIVAAVFFVLISWITLDQLAYKLIFTIIAALVIFNHRSNIKRMLNKDENTI